MSLLPRSALLALIIAMPIHAAEVQFQAESAPRGNIVRLGDVARIVSNDAREQTELAAIELFPTPAPGSKKFVRAREIQDTLESHGLALAAHRFSGASQVTIAGGAVGARQAQPMSGNARQVARGVQDAIRRYLEQNVATEETWSVAVELTDEQARRVVEAGRRLNVTGGREPWIGPQEFVLSWDGPRGAAQLPIKADVSLPAPIVVAARGVPKGSLLRTADLELRRVPPTAGQRTFDKLEEVVGRELTRTLSAGQVVDAAAIQAPLLVRRGELVDVLARSGGIQVRVKARAREDGAIGEIVRVESADGKQPYLARVSGDHEVEVYAQANEVPTTPVEPAPARAVRRPQLSAERKNPRG